MLLLYLFFLLHNRTIFTSRRKCQYINFFRCCNLLNVVNHLFINNHFSSQVLQNQLHFDLQKKRNLHKYYFWLLFQCDLWWCKAWIWHLHHLLLRFLLVVAPMSWNYDEWKKQLIHSLIFFLMFFLSSHIPFIRIRCR